MNIIHLSRAEYQTLSTTGTLTKSGVTYTFDPLNNEYVVPDSRFLHIVRLIVGGDAAYFDGWVKFISPQSEAFTDSIVNATFMKKAVSAVGHIGQSGVIQSYVIGIDKDAKFICHEPIEYGSDNVFLTVIDFTDHQNFTFSDSVVEL